MSSQIIFKWKWWSRHSQVFNSIIFFCWSYLRSFEGHSSPLYVYLLLTWPWIGSYHAIFYLCFFTKLKIWFITNFKWSVTIIFNKCVIAVKLTCVQKNPVFFCLSLFNNHSSRIKLKNIHPKHHPMNIIWI